ncbi:GGDEF domain-containing protein [Chitinivorax sp. B]|uniref:GGDEF domain-containing protein n=1 Tax=Chitinivorax sp. B TaxID=2502235 RepID=UPI0010F7F07E|nr:GGDEF domain-containing protein [Chitinivorax sp. B]
MPTAIHSASLPLDSLVDITSQRDLDNLIQVTASILQEHLDIVAIRVFRQHTADTDWDCFYQSTQSDRHQHAWLVSTTPITAQSPAHLGLIRYQTEGTFRVYGFPINGWTGVALIVELYADHPLEDDLELISIVLKVVDNLLSVLRQAHCDTLTGLLNRRSFDDRFAQLMVASAARQREIQQNERRLDCANCPCWLAICDIDHFKRINDTFGHVYGDEVLMLLAKLFMDNFREADCIFRFGGEEFVVMLSPCPVLHVHMVLERLRDSVARYAFPQVGQVTISIGYARIVQHVAPSDLIGQADQALYYAKEHGRNQVQCFHALLEQGLLSEPAKHDDMELF